MVAVPPVCTKLAEGVPDAEGVWMPTRKRWVLVKVAVPPRL